MTNGTTAVLNTGDAGVFKHIHRLGKRLKARDTERKANMTITRKLIVACLATLGIAAALSASGAGADPALASAGFGGPGHLRAMHHPAHREPPFCRPGFVAEIDQGVALARAFLALDDDQRSAFDTLASATHESAVKARTACETVRNADLPRTVPEATARLADLVETVDEIVATMRPAIDGFYATLNEEQKAALDTIVADHADRIDAHRSRFAPEFHGAPTEAPAAE